MRTPLRFVLVASQAAVASLVLACAHAPAADEPAPGTAPVAQEEPVAIAPRLVTGSRIPQRVGVCNGLPSTTENVRVYCRDRLVETGHDGDLGAQLRQLDPSISIHR